MLGLRITLVADGSSDKALLPILVWLLRKHLGNIPIQPEFADLRHLPHPPSELFERIDKSVELYPCDLLFVHRDAERESIEKRVSEICESLERCAVDTLPVNEVYESLEQCVVRKLPVACVVPVRMQEAWLLIDESALRKAAGNPQGRRTLNVPDPRRLEDLPNPKQILHDLLRQASELSGRRLRRFVRDMGRHAHRVAEQIDDFSPLCELTAFQQVERQVVEVRRKGNLPVFDGDSLRPDI